MTTQEFYKSALLSFGQDVNNERFSDDFFRSLSFAQQDFCTRRRWGFLRANGTVTTAGSTRTASLPDDFGMLYDGRGSVRYTSDGDEQHTEITVIDEQQYWQSHFDDDDEDVPNYCWLFGTTISFSPIPDDEYTINIVYYKKPTDITDGQSALTVPVQYHEVLIHMLRRRLQALGYSSVMEISISDTELNRLTSQFARDDIGRYGGMQMNLPPKSYTIKTV